MTSTPMLAKTAGMRVPPQTGAGGSRRSRPTWIEPLSRLGLVVRGLLYFLPGAFALAWALGQHRQSSMTQASAIDLIGQQPMGRALLVVVAAGLAGYAAWGVTRAILDPLQRGHSPVGIALRAGYAVSAIAYAGLLVATLRVVAGSLSSVSSGPGWSVALATLPFGRVVVVVVGLCWIFGSGLTQIVMGWRRSFERDLDFGRMGASERRWAAGLGRVGLVSRGIVFSLIGALILATAFQPSPHPDTGLDAALLELAHQPFGRALLGAAGIGLMVFGTFSAMCARWMRMRREPGTARPFPSRSS